MCVCVGLCALTEDQRGREETVGHEGYLPCICMFIFVLSGVYLRRHHERR